MIPNSLWMTTQNHYHFLVDSFDWLYAVEMLQKEDPEEADGETQRIEHFEQKSKPWTTVVRRVAQAWGCTMHIIQKEIRAFAERMQHLTGKPKRLVEQLDFSELAYRMIHDKILLGDGFYSGQQAEYANHWLRIPSKIAMRWFERIWVEQDGRASFELSKKAGKAVWQPSLHNCRSIKRYITNRRMPV